MFGLYQYLLGFSWFADQLNALLKRLKKFKNLIYYLPIFEQGFESTEIAAVGNDFSKLKLDLAE